MEFSVKKLSDLNIVAGELVRMMQETPLCLFYGSMGAGKTTLIAKICNVMQVTGNIASPTFTIVNEYRNPLAKPVFHIDLYRIKDLREALYTGIEEYLYSGNVCMVEWPELIEEIVEPPYIVVNIEALQDDSREISITRN